jgi:SIR2-like domain
VIDWPEQLIKDIARRRVVVMLGSGISKTSEGRDGMKPPTWGEFLEETFAQITPKSRHISYALRGGDYLSACQWIKGRMDERWNPFLRSRFLDPAYRRNRMHELIFSLDAGVYVTPNFDKIFDNYVADVARGTTIVKTYYDNDIPELIRAGTRVILKVHGTIDAPDRMIFTRADYANARTEHALFYQLMDALLLTNTFLILGCGLSDPDFQLLFENFAYRFPSAPPSLHGVRRKPTFRIRLFDSRNKKFEISQIF